GHGWHRALPAPEAGRQPDGRGGAGSGGPARVPPRPSAQVAPVSAPDEVLRMIIERQDLMEKVTALCKRRGFVYPSSEIYGGLGGMYDYGPYGVAIRRNIRNLWWRHVVELRDDVVGLEATIIAHPEIWVASGHVQTFADPLVDCLGRCHKRWRADHLE